MARMIGGVGLVIAHALNEVLKGLFIASFVDVGAAPHASKVACCFCKLMLPWCWLLFLLLLQELFDDLRSSLLLWHGPVWLCWLGDVFRNGELRTFFIEAFLEDLHSQALVHSYPTSSTLVPTSMRCPAVGGSRPGLAALCNEVLLVLLSFFALMPVGLLVDVMLFVTVDLGQAVDGMGIDELMVLILIQDLLPFSSLAVLVLLGPFPRCQCGIPLSAA